MTNYINQDGLVESKKKGSSTVAKLRSSVSASAVKLVSRTVETPKVAQTDDHAAAEFVNQLVDHAKNGMFTVTMNATAPIARALMTKNKGNRDIQLWKVMRFKTIILQTRWQNNAQGFIVGVDGSLLTGQHRCLGLIEADAENPGVSIEVMVTFGVPNEYRLTMDVGTARTLPDLCKMVGLKEPKRVATLATYIWRDDAFGSIKSPGPLFNPDENVVREVAETYYKQIGAALHYVDDASFPRRPPLAFVYYLMIKVCDALADGPAGDALRASESLRAETTSYLDKVGKGLGLEEGSVEMAIRNKFIAVQTKAIPNYWMTAELLIRGWNAIRNDRGIRSVMARGGKLPEIMI
jgi:hypothetical protein